MENTPGEWDEEAGYKEEGLKVDPDEGPDELMHPDTSQESETVEEHNNLRDTNQ